MTASDKQREKRGRDLTRPDRRVKTQAEDWTGTEIEGKVIHRSSSNLRTRRSASRWRRRQRGAEPVKRENRVYEQISTRKPSVSDL